MESRPIRWTLAIAVALGLLSGACSSGSSGATTPTMASTPTPTSTNTMTGVDGIAASLADTSRIVSLNGDLTEIAFALDAGDRVVGIDLTTTYPAEAAALPDVGLSRDLNAEAVIALDPTLVIGDTQVGPERAIEQIREAGIPVLILQAESTLAGVSRKIATMGDVLGLPDQARTLISEVEDDIAEATDLAATATSRPRVVYVYVRGPETLLLFGNGMPTHFLIEAAGGVDAAGEAQVAFAENLDPETLVATAPDVILTPTAGFDLLGGVDALTMLPGVADTPAGQSGRIYDYDEALLLGMGPRVGQALRQLVVDLHPELGS